MTAAPPSGLSPGDAADQLRKKDEEIEWARLGWDEEKKKNAALKAENKTLREEKPDFAAFYDATFDLADERDALKAELETMKDQNIGWERSFDMRVADYKARAEKAEARVAELEGHLGGAPPGVSPSPQWVCWNCGFPPCDICSQHNSGQVVHRHGCPNAKKCPDGWRESWLAKKEAPR